MQEIVEISNLLAEKFNGRCKDIQIKNIKKVLDKLFTIIYIS